MNDNRKDKNMRDLSTTDFFLKFIKDEKTAQEKEARQIEKNEERNRRLIDHILSLFNYVNRILDRMFRSRRSIMILSFILSLILYFTMSGGNILGSTTSGTTLKDVELKVEGLDKNYEVKGVPETVTIGLIGPSVDIYTTKIANDYEAYINLSDYTEGRYTVQIKTRNFDKDLTVMLLPETCNIVISPKVESTFDVEYRFTNRNDLDLKYSLSLKSISHSKVTVSASQSTISAIEHIYANIRIGSHTSSFTEEVKLQAYDADGRVLACDISPSTVKVEVEISDYGKSVAIKPVFKGNLKKGYQLKNYTLSDSTVTIYGVRSRLSTINAIECEVDLTDLSKTTIIENVPLQKAEHVNYMSIDTIDIKLIIEKE